MFKLMFHYRTCFNVPADLIWRATLYHFMKIIYRTFCLHKRILLDIVKNIQRNSTQNDNGKNIKVKIFYKINLLIIQALPTFWNADKIILNGYVMLLYVNNERSILFTQKNIW